METVKLRCTTTDKTFFCPYYCYMICYQTDKIIGKQDYIVFTLSLTVALLDFFTDVVDITLMMVS